ncbi:MAG: FAD-binding oxidoreductase [Planctomycetes bacterium]|nr:FAD-binding oxidoreductase [Planctomycetota bacterium]
MTTPALLAALRALADRLEGDLRLDDLARSSYATDASEYQERPLAVALPRSESDVHAIIRFAAAHRVPLVPRGAGTSLAGQVVGSGIIVDMGRHLDRIVAVDVARRRVRVQPGVVRNELNRVLAPHGLVFAPETSTAAWAMIGGMVGNNSCGSNSIAWGTTRDHLLSARGFLADGSEAAFGPLGPAEFAAKCAGPASLETSVYRAVHEMLGDGATRRLVRASFPRPEVTRRNTGYALDALMDAAPLDPASERPFNFCRLLAGSEGTLFFGVEYELGLIPLPPPGALLCVHCGSVDEALRATLVVMRPDRPADARATACELIDDKILRCTKDNLEQARNRAFVVGDPGAVLVVEMRAADQAAVVTRLRGLEAELREAGLGYAYPLLTGADTGKVWEIRRAGQGLINNLAGDARPREIVEDTAVAVADLSAYVAEFDRLLAERYGIDCVHYAHAGDGELHLRPLFDLRSPAGLKMFRDVASDVAALVKKYRGSLSGEHGDGRLRGEFIRGMVGEECYDLFRRVKRAFDPAGIFNPGKIVDAPRMDTSLRILPGEPAPRHETVFRFAAVGGVLRAAERCTGVGQCRKPAAAGGTMCPSYMATLDEEHTTRARANLLRQALSDPTAADPWGRPELAAVMDLCLSCKACKSECPSNVDMARLKAEWEQHRHDRLGVPWRSRLIAATAATLRRAARVRPLYNLAVSTPGIAGLVKRALGFAPRRSLPTLPATTLRDWWRRRGGGRGPGRLGRVHLFADEFTDTLDADVGIKAVELLERLGWEVVIPPHVDSGRAQLSQGLVREARDLAARNVELLADLVTAEAPLVGIEPSAILSFRDEYPDLVPESLAPRARALAGNTLLLDEFLAGQAAAGRIGVQAFTDRPRRVLVHGHCHQKALSSLDHTVRAVSLPRHYEVEVIPSGCCGMAGAFGYEREHYAVSMKIGGLVLFPAVRAAAADTILAAPGTSCRHQIADGTGRRALHTAEILHAALA